MSDPVTNVEIEDVLSSIRRLVSEDTRAKTPENGAALEANRLVLTPALRVASSDDQYEEEPEQAVSETAAEPMLLTNPTAPDAVEEEPPIQDVETVEEAGAEAQDDVQDALAAEEQTASDILAQLVEQEVANAFSEVEDEWAAADTDEQEADTADGSQDEAAEPSEPAEPIEAGETASDWSQDMPESVVSPLSQIEDIVVEDTVEPAAEDISEAPEAEQVVEPAPEPENAEPETAEPDTAVSDIGSTPETLEEKIATLEQMIGQGDATWDEDPEPEATSAAAFFRRSPDVLDWSEEQAPVEDTPEVEQDATDDLFTHQSPLDEEMLRMVVTDIVRSELQGVLGERITRNVRKLVRREIHRVMMNRD